MMLDTICREIKNYFTADDDKIIGDFSIVDGDISPSVAIQNGQYYRIVGSVFNDGVHKMGDETDVLVNEPEFHGAVWLMRVPIEFLSLVSDIEEWQAKYGSADSVNMSPYASESFGGYSYSKSASASASGVTWQSAFANCLNQYRKARLP